MTNKTTLKRLKLDPYFSKNIETNLNVWSHDQNSYEIKFEFYDHQCDKPIDLTGADMRILLDHAGSQPKIYPLEIESKVLGLAKFIMPEQIRGCEGKFTAHIYADYPNRTHDFGSFTFYTKLSRLDGDLGGCMDEIYVSEFEKALEDIKEFKVDIDKKINDMQEQFDDRYDKAKTDVEEIERLINENGAVKKEDVGVLEDFRSFDKTLIEKIKNEFTERKINVKWFGLKGDGVTDDTKALKDLLNMVSNKVDNHIKNSFKKVTLYFPPGTYIITEPLVIRSNISLVGYGSRRWGIMSDDFNCTTLLFTLQKSTDVALNFAGWNKQGVTLDGFSFAKENIGQPLFRVDDVNLQDINIESTNQTGVGINFLNVIMSRITNVSVCNFNVGIMHFSGWNNRIEHSFLWKNNKFGVVIHGPNNGGLAIDNVSINGDVNYENFENEYGLTGHDGFSTALFITEAGSAIRLEGLVAENYPKLIKVYKTENVNINSLTCEQCTVAMVEADNSRVTVNGGYQWNSIDKKSVNFIAKNKSRIKINDFKMMDWYQYPVKIDDTSSIVTDGVNFRPNEVSLGSNLVINRDHDNFVKSTGFTLSTVSFGKINYGILKDKMIAQNYNHNFYYEVEEIDTNTLNENDIVVINKKGASKIHGVLQFALSRPKNTGEQTKIITGILEAEGDRLYLRSTDHDNIMINVSVLKKYGRLRIFGYVMYDNAYDPI